MDNLRDWLLIALLIFLCSPARALELNIRVMDNQGQALANAVVYALPSAPVKFNPPAAVMDQQHKSFVPHVLAVPQGTSVSFPNTDSVNHYVYSFSPAKSFQFKLFKSDLTQHQMVFDQPGLVTLGCNIHDFMLAYIFVAPSPYVAVSDSTGRIRLQIPAEGDYSLHLWHELADEDLEALTQKIHLPTDTNNRVIQLRHQLQTPRLMHPEVEDY